MCTNCKGKKVVEVRVKNETREIPCGVCQIGKLTTPFEHIPERFKESGAVQGKRSLFPWN